MRLLTTVLLSALFVVDARAEGAPSLTPVDGGYILDYTLDEPGDEFELRGEIRNSSPTWIRQIINGIPAGFVRIGTNAEGNVTSLAGELLAPERAPAFRIGERRAIAIAKRVMAREKGPRFTIKRYDEPDAVTRHYEVEDQRGIPIWIVKVRVVGPSRETSGVEVVSVNGTTGQGKFIPDYGIEY